MNRYDLFSAKGDFVFSASVRLRALTALVAAGLGMATLAQAAPRALNARQLAGESSTFTLDFIDFGLQRQANVSATEFELEVDAVAGTARFVDYYQEIAPLLLPGPEGDVSTGNIIVEIESGATLGTYNPATGRFTTDDMYVIHFDGDLSAYELTSPVRLPGASAGVVTFAGRRSGRIDVDWAGTGQLPNPFVPQSFITFNYTCEVAAVFGPRAVRSVEVEATEGKRSAGDSGPTATAIASPAEESEAVEEKSHCTEAPAAGESTEE